MTQCGKEEVLFSAKNVLLRVRIITQVRYLLTLHITLHIHTRHLS